MLPLSPKGHFSTRTAKTKINTQIKYTKKAAPFEECGARENEPKSTFNAFIRSENTQHEEPTLLGAAGVIRSSVVRGEKCSYFGGVGSSLLGIALLSFGSQWLVEPSCLFVG